MQTDELRKLTNRINCLQFHGSGWLKAVMLDVEDLGAHLFGDEPILLPDLLTRFRKSPGDVGIHKELLTVFLEEWCMYETNEGNDAHSLDSQTFTREPRSAALTLVDTIITETLKEPGHEIDPWFFVRDPPNEPDPVDYSQLRSWFADVLFSDCQSSFYVKAQTPAFVSEYGLIYHAVVGISPQVIGMFWYE